MASYRRGGVSVGAYRVEDNRGVGSGCGIACCGDVGVPVDPDVDRRYARLGETYSESACGVDACRGEECGCETDSMMSNGCGEEVALSKSHVGPVLIGCEMAREGRGVGLVPSEGVGGGVSRPAALEAICCGMVDASWPDGLDQHGSLKDDILCLKDAGERLKDDTLCGCWHKK